jgi:hypothetical protein
MTNSEARKRAAEHATPSDPPQGWHDEWCPKNGCRCGKCPCAKFTDCPAPSPTPDAALSEEEVTALATAIYGDGESAAWLRTVDDSANSASWDYAQRAVPAVEHVLAARMAALTERLAEVERERDDWKRRRDNAVETCRFRHQDGLTAEEWHNRICGAMEGVQRERCRAEAAEAERDDLRAVVERVGALAGRGEIDEIDEPWVRVADLRAALASGAEQAGTGAQDERPSCGYCAGEGPCCRDSRPQHEQGEEGGR